MVVDGSVCGKRNADLGAKRRHIALVWHREGCSSSEVALWPELCGRSWRVIQHLRMTTSLLARRLFQFACRPFWWDVNALRYMRFSVKVTTCITSVLLHARPPTAAAAWYLYVTSGVSRISQRGRPSLVTTLACSGATYNCIKRTHIDCHRLISEPFCGPRTAQDSPWCVGLHEKHPWRWEMTKRGKKTTTHLLNEVIISQGSSTQCVWSTNNNLSKRRP